MVTKITKKNDTAKSFFKKVCTFATFRTLLRLIVKINKNKAINRENVIQLKDINKTYNNGAPLHVLKGINLDIQKGEFVSIMGASGSGKSTLLNILGILDSYDTGEYYLNGTLIKNLSETKAAEYRNRMIGFIFQSFNLISFKNAVENVALPLFYQGVSRRKRNALALGISGPPGAERVGTPHAKRDVRRTETTCSHCPCTDHPTADYPCR